MKSVKHLPSNICIEKKKFIFNNVTMTLFQSVISEKSGPSPKTTEINKTITSSLQEPKMETVSHVNTDSPHHYFSLLPCNISINDIISIVIFSLWFWPPRCGKQRATHQDDGVFLGFGIPKVLNE